ncbi:helix-turn-helix transcriptional regulator [Paenibacillus sp. FSL R7-0331]|uniref:helix-turn-helix transcriptional regulator n=1 Tax=Paenibacillus sp. FSL R7-0331 TaxID=1536773 RepID=UPI0004F87628|nr:AraC family transcriptional regulator [Paenibacillus sp. FSL R7-0331]AIQ52275.1 AraC family transcriptional regulator [Paenibacillus sp. FSL R7-0331]
MIFPPSYIHLAAPPFPYFLECDRTVYQPGDQHPSRKAMGKFDLILVEQGCLYLGEEHKQWAVPAGHSLLLLPDRYHYPARPCEVTTSFIWVHFHTVGEWAEAEGEPVYADRDAHFRQFLTYPYTIRMPQFGPLPDPFERSGQAELLLQLNRVRRSGAVWQQQRIFEEMLRMMDQVQQDTAGSHAVEIAEQTEAYIRNHYAEPLTNALLSEELHFHYNYLARCMKRVYGLTPMEYLTDYRLEQAKLLLLKTELSVGGIAERAGFESAAYFSRRFTGKVGISPLRYRKRYSR